MKAAMTLAALCAAVLLVGTVQGDKIQVGYYSEGLCPYCAMFMDDFVLPMSENGIMGYVDFTMIPSGNVYVNQTTGEVFCQHGPDECTLNKLLNCAIAQSTSQKEGISFVACIEKVKNRVLKNPKLAQKCADKVGMDLDKVNTCTDGKQGEDLFRKAIAMTNHLKVDHEFVPWVVVNGIPLYEGMGYLRSIICISIPADERPQVCYENPIPQSDDYAPDGPEDEDLIADTSLTLPARWSRTNQVA